MGDEDARTLWVGQLSEQVTDELLYELFLQAGPLEKVKRVKGKPFAFITFQHEVSVPYSMELMYGVKLFGNALKMQYRGGKNSTPQGGGGLEYGLQRSYSAPNPNRQGPGPSNHGNMAGLMGASPQLQRGQYGGRHDQYQGGSMFDTPGRSQFHGNQAAQMQGRNLDHMAEQVNQQLANLLGMSPQQPFMQQQNAPPWQQQRGYHGRY